MKIIMILILGYFLGMASVLSQIISMEKRENKKIKEILESDLEDEQRIK